MCIIYGVRKYKYLYMYMYSRSWNGSVMAKGVSMYVSQEGSSEEKNNINISEKEKLPTPCI